MEVKDETRDDSDGLLGENAKTGRGAAANDDATRHALENMVLVDAVVLLCGDGCGCRHCDMIMMADGDH